VKSIKKNYVKKHVRHQSFVDVISNPALVTDATFRLFQSRNHDVRLIEMKEVCLSATEDKRYVLDDGVSTCILEFAKWLALGVVVVVDY